MTALKSIGCILLLCLLLSLLRVGVVADIGGALRVRLCIGPVRRTVLPKRKKPPKSEKKTAAEKKPAMAKKHRLPKPTHSELRALVETALGALGRTLRRTCKRTRIDPLELCVRFAGSDPADVAQTYGYACAALWTFMPRLEELFYIPRPSILLDMDFQAEKTTVEGTVGVTLRVCDLFAILFTIAPPLAKWFLRYRRAHRNDTAPPVQGENGAAEVVEKSEKLTA